MPGWQKVYDQNKDKNFEILSVAVDGQGSEVVKPHLEGTTFTTVVDENNTLVNMFNFKMVPNGIFIDEEGTIRLIKEGFSVDNYEHVEAVEQLINKEVEKVEFDEGQTRNEQTDLQLQLAQTKFKLGMEYAKQNRDEEALKELDDAILLDPDNFTIRKQRWYIRYPEKFGQDIDFDWQKEQLNKELKKEEQQRNQGLVCGPDGCFIPQDK
ncbi:thioredoxin family protein [Halalkalibacillus sediminis]|uniref:Thioredoxin family protein n=1 Tax=Halalkalibacillus sediminis TaxID=2018042 RepID=A0A2I0QWP4_9BACI|nr:TlpA disulfide reductase family protein [Halalkalibacillus sediminis]PKR78761.1 thioredoxin family protein [Halalkalibacillus sediminis]